MLQLTNNVFSVSLLKNCCYRCICWVLSKQQWWHSAQPSVYHLVSAAHLAIKDIKGQMKYEASKRLTAMMCPTPQNKKCNVWSLDRVLHIIWAGWLLLETLTDWQDYLYTDVDSELFLFVSVSSVETKSGCSGCFCFSGKKRKTVYTKQLTKQCRYTTYRKKRS